MSQEPPRDRPPPPEIPIGLFGDDHPDPESPPPVSNLWGSERPRRSERSAAQERHTQRALEATGDEGGAAAERAALAHAIDQVRRESATGLDQLHEMMTGLSQVTVELARDLRQSLGSRAPTAPNAPTEVGKELHAVRRELAGLRGELETLRSGLRGELEALRSGLAEASQGDPEAALHRMDLQLDALRRDIGELHSALPEASALREAVRAELGAVRAQLSEIARTRGTDPTAQLVLLETRTAEVLRSIEAISGRFETATAEPAGPIVRTEAASLRSLLETIARDLASRLDTVSARTGRLESELTEFSARLEPPEGALEILRNDARAGRREFLEAAQVTDERIRSTIAALAKEVVAIADEQRQLRDELRRVAARIVGRA